MREHINQYKYIYLISVIGFILTGVLAYPHILFWDNQYVLDSYVLNGHPPTNWMGWFYPYFWKFLYDITGNQFIIGVVHNVLYWFSISILYINFFPKKSEKSYIIWFLILAFNPFVLGQLVWVTNNVLLLSFVLLALALFSIAIKMKKKFITVFSILLLFCAILVRKDAFLLVFPLIVYFFFVLFDYKKIAPLLSITICMISFVILTNSVNNSIKNYSLSTPNRMAIDTVGLVGIYDLTLMSAYKRELLIPDSILKPEFQGENRYKIMDKIFQVGIPVLAFEWNPFSAAISPFLQTGTVWNAGLNMETLIPIYIDNVLFYIWLKINMLYGYLIPLVSFLILSIFAMNFLRNKRFQAIFSDDIRSLSWILIISSWIYSMVIILASNSVQYRYVISSTMLIWFVSVFILCQVFTNYKREVVWTKIED